MIERITAAQAREMVYPNERGEEILKRLYPRIKEAARNHKSVLVIGVRATQTTAEWVKNELEQDGYEVCMRCPWNDPAATHAYHIRW